MGLGFIAGVGFMLFIMGIMNTGKAVEVDEYNEKLIDDGKKDRKLISDLQVEHDIYTGNFNNTREKSRNKSLRDEVKLLNSFLDSFKNNREA